PARPTAGSTTVRVLAAGARIACGRSQRLRMAPRPRQPAASAGTPGPATRSTGASVWRERTPWPPALAAGSCAPGATSRPGTGPATDAPLSGNDRSRPPREATDDAAPLRRPQLGELRFLGTLGSAAPLLGS